MSKKYLIILAVVILLLIIGLGGWWYIYKKPASYVSVNKIVKEDQVGNWKIYTNEEFDFQISVPPQLIKKNYEVKKTIFPVGTNYSGKKLSALETNYTFRYYDPIQTYNPPERRFVEVLYIDIFSNKDAETLGVKEFITGIPMIEQPEFSYDRVIKSDSYTYAILKTSFQDCMPDVDLCNLITNRTQMVDSFTPEANKLTVTTRDSKRAVDLNMLQNALELYYTKNGKYPIIMKGKWLNLENALINAGIGITKLPSDPLSNFSYSYASSSDGQYYVLAATLEDLNNSLIKNDLDGEIYDISCNDPVYCVGMIK